MDEQQQPGILTDALVREAISIVGTVVLVWMLTGTGRIYATAIRDRIRARWHARRSRLDGEVAQFAHEISRWDHEQSAQQDRRPGNGPCGCTG